MVLLLALIVPYQALLTPMFLMFAKLGLKPLEAEEPMRMEVVE